MSFNVSERTEFRLQASLEKILPTQLSDVVLSHHTVVTYPGESSLFLPGAPADVIFWILSGIVKLYCPVGRSRILVGLAGPGDVIGVVDCLRTDGVRQQAWEAQARTKCTVALVTREHIAKSIATLDKTRLTFLLEHLSTAWSQWLHHHVSLIGLSYKERLETVLKDLGARFGVPDERGTRLTISPSHDELAEMIYSSRPTVTKLVSEMINAHSLYREGKLYILPRKEGPRAFSPATSPVQPEQDGLARRNGKANHGPN
jgi:CRP-like cAMP-binding protein